MKLEVAGDGGVLRCGWSGREAALAALDKPYSYRVDGAQYSDAFKAGQWDGRRRLVRRLGGMGDLGLPPGLADDAAARLRKAGISVEVVDARVPRPWACRPTWSGHGLRDHQRVSVAACVASPGGLLDLPVRSGKTLVAARVALELGQRTLFVAPSDFLVAQARDVFRAALSGARTTVVGLGDDDATGDVVVASIATLAARLGSPWHEDFRRGFGVAFLDECHHLFGEGDDWRAACLALDVGRRYGLTGTLRAQDPQVRLWSHGICGPVLHRESIAALTARGLLIPLEVRFVRHGAPRVAGGWTRTTYREAVVECAERNAVIAREASTLARAGTPTLVDCAQVGHARRIIALLRGELRPGEVRLLTGASSQDERDDVVVGLRSGRVRVVVSTVLGEGVDVPELGAVVNAEGGRASPSTIQRLRCLTPAPGKERAVLVDFVDDHRQPLAGWTLERVRLYRQEGFDVRVEAAGGRDASLEAR